MAILRPFLISPKETARALEHLSAVDDRLAKVIQTVGKYKIRARQDAFESLVEAIIYQQLAGSAAGAIHGRFIEIYRGTFPKPTDLLATDLRKLRAAGLSARKIEYLRDLALNVSDNRLKIELLPSMTDKEVVEQLA